MIRLYIGKDQSVPRHEVLLILPTPEDPKGKASVILSDGRVLKSPLSAAALKKRLDDYERIN